MDLCKAINDKAKIKFIGIRPGEKMHEELISQNESTNTYSISNFYVILSTIFSNKTLKEYKKFFKLKTVNNNFTYNSLLNKEYLSIKQLREIIRSYL